MKRTLVASLIVATASGCGGGKSATPAPAPVVASPAPTPAPTPSPITLTSLKGVFGGTISTGRNFNGVVLPDGTLYGIYAAAGNSSLVGGLIQGTGTSSNNTTFTSSSIKDFNAEGLGVREASLAATFEASLFFNGTVTYVVSSISPLTFSTSIFDQPGTTDVSTVAGTYSGSFADSPAGRINLTLVLDATGNVTANASNGCHLTGQISPISILNTFSLSLVFGPAPCTSPSQVFSGAAFYNTTTRVLEGGAPSPDRSNAAVFILTKQ